MTEKERKEPMRELTAEELDAQQANVLPDREEMSIINPNSPLPWDPRTATLTGITDDSGPPRS